ncbi:MAG: hypothetical protein QNJ00_15140 [Woeseiaceae bacterium]|nr:hypothetical protein [Woeseiaceae bacterium]
MALIYSIVTLLAGPFIYAWGRRKPVVRQVIDGFVLITVAGIVCAHIIPDSIEGGGLLALAFLAVGLLFPIAIEKAFHHSMQRAHVFIVLLAAAGLVIHAIIDGIALLPGNSADTGRTNSHLIGSIFGNELALGVILHRLPVGMAIWWSVRPSFGTAAAVGAMLMIVVATTLAYVFGGAVVDWAATRELAWFQGFVAGSLVHVVAFGVSHDHDAGDMIGGVSWRYRVGILLAMFLAFTVPEIY